MRLGEFGELLGRREALDRRRQHGVGIGVAIGRAIKLRLRQRGAQFEAARFLRHKNTVGVSAVRDLFGTVQNEGASKGILVTTSGYGKAAFEFAKGKPLELLDGANLLHLLGEHAGIDARIVMPEGWIDLSVHGE